MERHVPQKSKLNSLLLVNEYLLLLATDLAPQFSLKLSNFTALVNAGRTPPLAAGYRPRTPTPVPRHAMVGGGGEGFVSTWKLDAGKSTPEQVGMKIILCSVIPSF